MSASWKKWALSSNWQRNLDFLRSRCYNTKVVNMGQYSSWSKRRDSKSRRPGNWCKGSNPFCPAKKQDTPTGCPVFWRGSGIRKDGPTGGRVKKCPVDTFLVRGRIHVHSGASGWMWTDVHNWLRCFLMVSKVCKGAKNQKVHFRCYEVHIVQKAVYIWKRFEYNENISRTLR